MSKIGRNDPCPCGSGKKYKHCCIGKYDNVDPIGGVEFDFKRYQNMVESWDHDKGPAPTFNEFMGRPNAATESMRGLQEMLGDRKFETKKELEDFVRDHMLMQNSAPLDEFLGLSPDQMSGMLNRPFSNNKSVVEINTSITADAVRGVLALLHARYLIGRIGESEKGIKATPKGNFSRDFAREFYDVFVRENDILKEAPSGEDDVKDLSRMKHFLEDEGYIKRQKGWFSLTKKGGDMLDNFDPAALYLRLFAYFMDEYYWLYLTRYPDPMDFLQTSQVFCLYILKKKAPDFVFAEELADAYIKAFPQLPKDCGSEYGETLVVSGFAYIFLGEIAEYLGLVEARGGNWVLFREREFRTTDLFRELLVWKL